MTRIEVRPASLSMVQSTVEGDKVRVDEDVQNVARDLREIDAGLKLEYDTVQRFYAVKWEHLNQRGELVEKLVLTALELDQRIVERVRYINLPDYDFAREIERQEAQAQRDADRERLDTVTGPAGERLRHAIRKDLGFEDRIFVPGDKP
jgi:hypothetical protein